MNRWALQCALLMVSQQLVSQCFSLNYTDASQGCRKESKCLSLLVFGAVICCHPSLSHVLDQSPCLIWIGWAPNFVNQTSKSGHLLADCQSDKSIIHCYNFLQFSRWKIYFFFLLLLCFVVCLFLSAGQYCSVSVFFDFIIISLNTNCFTVFSGQTKWGWEGKEAQIQFLRWIPSQVAYLCSFKAQIVTVLLSWFFS